VSNSVATVNFSNDELWMQRCLDLASNGLGNVAPNPLVGCVIIHKNNVIGESYHQTFGLAHAEVNAINAVKNKNLLSESTLYVNLEPCSHQGKTPPCSDLLISYKIKKVVIGALDSNEIVNGAGIKKLKAAGIEVVVNVLKDKCIELNKRFYTFHKKKRPFYILKWAETKDGFIYSEEKDQAISNKLSNQKVHQIRAQEQAILIGKNTLLTDNPSLNVRLSEGKNPLRIVVMSHVDENIKQQKIFKDGIPTLIFNTDYSNSEEHIEYIKYPPGGFISKLNEVLYGRGIASVLVEGGTNTLNSFIKSNTWDKAIKITSNQIFNNGTKSPTVFSSVDSKSTVGQGSNMDSWNEYINHNNK